MNSALTGKETGLMLYYKLNEGAGSKAVDYVNNNLGTLTNTVWRKNSGVKQIRVKQGSTIIQSSNTNSYTFTLSSGSYTLEVEDNVGNITSKNISL
jgi:uncharacterized protein YfaS (alpha-2-macroglobulin family)